MRIGNKDSACASQKGRFWPPFTASRRSQARAKSLIAAEGVWYRSEDGRGILDGTSGLWCVNAGHGRESIAAAVSERIRTLDYGPPFQLQHPFAAALASRLARMMPGPLSEVFFTNSGSEAVDTALKTAIAYQRAIGRSKRTMLVGRDRGYHGAGIGSISVGGMVANREPFAPLLLTGCDHLPHTLDDHTTFVRGQPENGAEKADALEAMISRHGADSIAAVIVEPMAGSAGVLVPPMGYLERLREITFRHEILLIFDEVITGFGRLGCATAAERFGVVPDMITLAKGMTNGVMPMGAMVTHPAIRAAIEDAAPSMIELPHGYTYSGHPVACAAAAATLDIYEHEQLFARSAEISAELEGLVHSLNDAPHVVDVRNLGMAAGVQLAQREGMPGVRSFEVFERCFEAGILIRVTGDTMALAPPLTMKREELELLTSTLRQVLERVA